MNKIIRCAMRLSGLAVLLYLCYHVVMGHWGIRSYVSARKERIKTFKQYDVAVTERNRLQEELQAFRKDPLFIEEQVKLTLKKGRKGEIYYHFAEKDTHPR